MKNIIENTLQILSKNRPIFHSEADFQFALAWELKTQNSNLDIRMERPYIDFKSDTMIIP